MPNNSPNSTSVPPATSVFVWGVENLNNGVLTVSSPLQLRAYCNGPWLDKLWKQDSN